MYLLKDTNSETHNVGACVESGSYSTVDTVLFDYQEVHSMERSLGRDGAKWNELACDKIFEITNPT